MTPALPDTPSDVLFVVSLGLSVVALLVFAVGKPRVWPRDPLGVVIFFYALSVFALLALIVYGIVFGQPVIEPIRFAVALGLAIALVAKTRAFIVERRRGRMPKKRPEIPPKKESVSHDIEH